MGMTKTQKIVVLGLLSLFAVVSLIFRIFMKVTFNGLGFDKMRGCDPKGCGYFGASRGTKKHRGVDLIYEPWEAIYAPFKLKIKRFGRPYADTDEFGLVEFVGLGIFSVFKVKVMYTDSIRYRGLNEVVEKGVFIGNAQDIAKYHGGGMVNHIHVEIRCMGVLINPTPFIKFKK